MIKILEVGSPEFNLVLHEAAKAGYETARTLFQKEQESEKMYTKDEAMKKLNCGKSKFQQLVNDGEINVTDTRPQHVTGSSIEEYFQRKLRSKL